MNVDLSSKLARNALRYETAWSAERKGRASAFADIERKGFAFAYAQSEVMDFGMDFHSPAIYFMKGYRQAVLGYWMGSINER